MSVVQVEELKACMRDLVSLVALPAMWTGQRPETIVETLPDILVTTLRLQFAYVRLDRDGEAQSLEAVRWEGRSSAPLEEVRQSLQRWIFQAPIATPTRIACPLGGDDIHIVVSHFATVSAQVVIVAGACRAGFPTENEALLLRVAGNQLQVGLRSAWLLEEVRRAEETALRASQLARDADRRKDEFLAMLGHELRNPLAPIVTALQLMRVRAVGSEREQTVIERQVHHLIRLVDDLLDTSRITKGTVELSRRPIELAEIVASAIETVSPLFEQRRHHLTVDVPCSGLVVDADAPRLTQVLTNLLTNAGRYTPHGGRIDLRAVSSGKTVTVSMVDSGIGIAPELLPTIFDAFVQAKRSSDRADGGLGLGLAIVRKLVELHGGTVRAHSAGPGKGSEFTIEIPLSGARPVATTVAPPASRRGRTRPLRVLVVDDNEDAAALLCEMIEHWGHQACAAHDGPAALAAAQQFRPEVALVDIGLPVMDGHEVAERLMSMPDLSRIRVIAVTGYGQPADRERTRALGFHEHFVKPVEFGALRASLDAACLALALDRR